MTSGFQILFEVDRNTAKTVIKNLRKRLTSAELANWMHDVAEPYVKLRIEGRFDSEGDDVSGKWHPLTRATQMIRANHGFPPDHPINVRTGEMKDWLLMSPSDIKVQGPEIELTHPPASSDPKLTEKLKVAQEGSSRPKTPARPVLGFNENDLLFLTSELSIYLIEGSLMP